jgi:hypothetical protein
MSIIRDGLQSADLDVPVTSPTLNLDFANSQSLDPRITFTRGSIGTFVNKNGLIETAQANVPRIDYDPISGECRGLLIEESRSNLLLQSSSPDNLVSPWSKGPNTTRVGFTTAPDGTNTAVIYYGNGSNAFEYVNQAVNLSANTTYTCSVWAKLIAGTGSVPTLGTIISASYNNGVSNTRSTVSYNNNLTTEWKRYSTTFTNINALTGVSMFFIADQNNTAQIAIWGAQLETGAFPTSYIPTSASTVTRSLDNTSMTGTNFSSWYNQTESTILCNFNAYNLMSTVQPNVFQISGPEPSGLNRIQLKLNGSGGGGTTQPIYHNLYQNGPNFADYFGFPYVTGLTKNIMRYKDGDAFVTVKDGGRVTKNTSTPRGLTLTLTKTMTTLSFGGFNGAISKFAYYPKALNDAEIQYLTQ